MTITVPSFEIPLPWLIGVAVVGYLLIGVIAARLYLCCQSPPRYDFEWKLELDFAKFIFAFWPVFTLLFVAAAVVFSIWYIFGFLITWGIKPEDKGD